MGRGVWVAIAGLWLLPGALLHASDALPPPPYSLPWLLRPANAASVVRLDSTFALFEDTAGRGGTTFVGSLTASYKATTRLSPLFRVSFVQNDAPTGASGAGTSNPLLGVSYVKTFARTWRLSLFGAATVPIGSGGGGAPDLASAAAMSAAIPARSAMDNALFAVNYFTVIGGLGVARVTPALTLQAEATLLQLTRARGPETQDGSRTNLALGLHVGHFFTERVSLGGELRLQRWLSNAAPVRNDPAAREQVTAALGLRLHFKVGGRHWLRPGVSYTRALDDPMAKRGYDIVQVDVPFVF